MSLFVIVASSAALLGGATLAEAIRRKRLSAMELAVDEESRAAMRMILPHLGAARCLVSEGRAGRGLDPSRLVRGVRTPHWGFDIMARRGTEVYAAKPAVCVRSGPISGYGETVCLTHLDEPDRSTLYTHLDDRIGVVGGNRKVVEAGDLFAGGDLLGHVGATTYGPGGRPPDWEEGRAASMAPHLHFEVHPHATPRLARLDTRLDPVEWLSLQGILPACEEV